MRFVLILFLVLTAPVFAELRVGGGKVKITPPPGTPMAGYYSARAVTEFHDDLYAKALVFEQDGSKAAVISCDLISLPRYVVLEAREAIGKLTKVPPQNVMISATHTHTGPVVPSRSSRDSALGGDSDLSQQYVRRLPELIAQAVKEAEGALAPAKASTATGREDDLAFNRRFHMKDGTVGWNPGKMNPNIVEPAGPTDPAVPVVYFEAEGGKPLATYVNFAMHLDTVGGQAVSADYPGALAGILSKVKGESMLTVFTTGTCGDINHVNVTNREPQKGHVEAERIGTILAGEVIKTYAKLKPAETFAPRAKIEVLNLPLAPYTPEELAKAQKDAVRRAPDAPKFIEQVQAFKVLDVHSRQGKPLEVEVQVIALGPDLAFVSLPGEIFVELGLAIKQASPFKQTIIAELANGSIGYIPTKRAYPQGAYEVISARCAEGSGEMLVEAATRLLKELKGSKGN